MTNGEKFKDVFGFGADGSRVIAVNSAWWDCEYQNHKRSNADKIRAMTDEELANFIVHHDCCPGFVTDTFSDANRKKYGFDGRSERCECGECCCECWLDWLRQEAEEGE